jgi:Skp family chaperone for outer membrane proteins
MSLKPKVCTNSDLEEKLARRRKKKQEQIDSIKAQEAEADKDKMQSDSDSLKQMMRVRKLTALTDMARQVRRLRCPVV